MTEIHTAQQNIDVLLTSKEVAKLLRVKEQTLAKWRSEQCLTLPFIKIGRTVRYRKSDVDHLLTS